MTTSRNQPTALPRPIDEKPKRSRRRRWTSIGIAVAIVFAIAGIAAAVLMSQATIDGTATADDRVIAFAVGTSTNQDQDGAVTGTVTGDGVCTTDLTAGALTFDFAGFWIGSECAINATNDGTETLMLLNPSATPITVTGVTYPADFGAPGSGAPILVEVLNGSNPMTFPFVLDPGDLKTALVVVTIDDSAAIPGASYAGQVTIDGA